MRKWLLIVLALGAAFGGVGAGVATAADKVVRWASSDFVSQTVAPLVQQFERENPGIKIEFVQVPRPGSDQRSRYVTFLAAQTADIDIYTIDIVWPAEFASAGWARPLDDFFSRSEREKFLDAPMKGVTVKGKVYAVPFYTDAGMLYYRRDLLEKEGLKPPKTWSELVNSAKILQQKYGVYGYAGEIAQYSGLPCTLLEFFTANGAEFIDDDGRVVINSPKGVEALQFLHDLVYKYKVTPEGMTTFKEEDARPLFQEGKVAFQRNWNYAWANFDAPSSKVKGLYGVIPFPAGKGKPSATLGGWNLMISRFSKQPELAWKVIDFMTSLPSQKYLATEASLLPTRKAMYSDADLLKKAPYIKDMYEIFKAAVPRPVSPFWSQLSGVIEIEVHKALTNQQTPKEALDKAAVEMEKILSQTR